MTRAMTLPIMGTVLLGPALVHTAPAADVTATVGATKANGGCVSFIEVPGREVSLIQGRILITPALVSGEHLKLRIENRCEQPWNIRIDRLPKESFSKDCVSYATEKFDFEDENLFAKPKGRGVDCLVIADHKKGTYGFQITESSPSQKKRGPKPATPPVVTHVLEIQVDP